MATPYHLQCGQFKRYRLPQCTFLTKCIQIRNISPFLIRPSVRTGAPSPRGKVWCSASLQIPIYRPAEESRHTYFLKSIPEGDTASHILYLVSYISVPCAFGDGRPQGWCAAQRIINLNDCRWQSCHNLCPYAGTPVIKLHINSGMAGAVADSFGWGGSVISSGGGGL